MRLVLKVFWWILSKIPGKWIINLSKGLLPSLWAFYLLDIRSFNVIEKYATLFTENVILKFVLYYFLVYLCFYLLLDFIVRLLLMRVLGKRIWKYFSEREKKKDVNSLRDFAQLKTTFLKGMGFAIDMGYVSKQELIINNEIKVPSDDKRRQSLHEFGNTTCNWIVVAIHLILTGWLILDMNLGLVISVFTIGVLLLVMIFSAFVLALSGANAIPHTNDGIRKL